MMIYHQITKVIIAVAKKDNLIAKTKKELLKKLLFIMYFLAYPDSS